MSSEPVKLNMSHFNNETVIQVAANTDRSMALTIAGNLYLWGTLVITNYPYPRTMQQIFPRWQYLFSTILSFSSGLEHVLLMTPEGLYGFGGSTRGQVRQYILRRLQ